MLNRNKHGLFHIGRCIEKPILKWLRHQRI